MTTCTILLAPDWRMSQFFCNSNAPALARKMYEDHEYEAVANIETELDGEDAAESAFDLTNNPGRQEERERVYGRGRSLSTGDIVIVSGVPFLCASCGWEVL